MWRHFKRLGEIGYIQIVTIKLSLNYIRWSKNRYNTLRKSTTEKNNHEQPEYLPISPIGRCRCHWISFAISLMKVISPSSKRQISRTCHSAYNTVRERNNPISSGHYVSNIVKIVIFISGWGASLQVFSCVISSQ